MSKKVEDFLEHYGVKGMKWGVRRNRSAASKLSTNARTNNKDAYPGLSTKKSGHAGNTLSTSGAKKNLLRNTALDAATAGFHRRARANSAKRTLKRLEGKTANTSTFRGRRKQRKINEAKVNAALTYALAKPRKKIYVTKDGQTSVIKGKKLAKQILKNNTLGYEDIRLRP
jgi:hypothetical protein